MNNIVLQGGVLLVLILDSVLVLIQVLSERNAFQGIRVGIWSYSFV